MAIQVQKRVLTEDDKDFIFDDPGGEITVTVELIPEWLRTIRLLEGRDFEVKRIGNQVLVDLKKTIDTDIEATAVLHYKEP